MEKRIKNLTELISDGTPSSELNSGKIAFANEIYDQAWRHLLNVYSSSKSSSAQKGEAAYYLYSIMRDISSDDSLIDQLGDEDVDLKMISKNKILTKEYIRKYLGRKYLKESAECGYALGLVEYGLLCVDCGGKGSFTYEYNDKNAEAGLAWANKMLSHEADFVRHAGYVIYTKYYFVKAVREKSSVYVKKFGDNLLEAKKLAPSDQYTQYFLGHLYTNPAFSSYNNGYYSNIKTGYEYFCEAAQFATDPGIIRSATEIKKMLETKYYSALR